MHITRGSWGLARGNRKDKVTVSFHYLTRVVQDSEGEPKLTKVTAAEFKVAMDKVAALPPSDTSTQEGVDKLRFSSTVPVENLSEIEPNLYFGTYKAIYTGHTYHNTAKGEIPCNSASIGHFTFLHIIPKRVSAYI